MSSSARSRPSDASAARGTSHWWFIGAAVVVTLGPVVVGGGDPHLWLQIVFIGVGLLLIGVGGYVMGRERRAARGRR